MKVLQRYFTSEIAKAIIFALIAFLALFTFFDLMGQLENVGTKSGYHLQNAVLYVLLGMPGNIYQLMPTAALIGAIYALSQFAARSEFTIMRVSSLSTSMAIVMLSKIAVLFVVVTFIFGEVIAPRSSDLAEKIRLGGQGSALSDQFKSGLWAKDVIRTDGVNGNIIGSRFLNIAQMSGADHLENIKIYSMDTNFHLQSIIVAKSGQYQGDHEWKFYDVEITHFPDIQNAGVPAAVRLEKQQEIDLQSEVTPDILSVLFADPDRMSIYELYTYLNHLKANNQSTDRYDIAFWKKVVYPFSIFVMMALALPFAYLHFRAGGISLKIFTGIMIGVGFQLLNTLFSHIGLLNGWPAFFTASFPSLFCLIIALFALRWVERH